MPFEFRNLDRETRRRMGEEIAAAILDGNLYYSKRFNQAGIDAWPSLLSEAAVNHDEHWLAYQLESQGHIKGMEGSATPSGGYTIKHVPHTAAETMAEGQFNRYYILAVCGRAIASGTPQVVVYRAKEVAVLDRNLKLSLGNVSIPSLSPMRFAQLPLALAMRFSSRTQASAWDSNCGAAQQGDAPDSATRRR